MTLHVPRLPFALDPLIGEAKRRARQRRLLVALIAILVVVIAAGLTLGLRSSGGGPGAGFAVMGTSAHVGSLAVPIPLGFHRYNVDEAAGITSLNGPPPSVIGVTLTSYRVTPDASLRTTGSLPVPARRNGVVLQVVPYFSIGAIDPPRIHLPLGFDQRWAQPPALAAGTLRWGVLHVHGQDYEIRVWTGRTAPPHDRAALLHAITSIRPTH